MKSKLKQIQFKRFYEIIEERKNKIWTVEELLERINRVIPSNLELTKVELRLLISHQCTYQTFKCPHNSNGKTTTYYIFRKTLPIEK